MQETQYIDTTIDEIRRQKEFFQGTTDAEVISKMDSRLNQLKKQGHTFVRRTKIGRNAQCPCGSGLKFKKCCIQQGVV